MIKVAVSGGFDPIHKGHVEHMRLAKCLGDWLVVLLNPDEHMVMKKGYCFMPYEHREAIVKEFRCVDEIVKVIDDDGTVAKTLRMVKPDIFAKGGDRDSEATMPQNELDACRDAGIKIIYGVGEKLGSSSVFVKNVIKVVELQ